VASDSSRVSPGVGILGGFLSSGMRRLLVVWVKSSELREWESARQDGILRGLCQFWKEMRRWWCGFGFGNSIVGTEPGS
jgi:hypothetical protein